MAEKCIVKSVVSPNAIFVLAGSAAGAAVYTQSPPIGALIGGVVVLIVLKAL